MVIEIGRQPLMVPAKESLFLTISNLISANRPYSYYPNSGWAGLKMKMKKRKKSGLDILGSEEQRQE